MQSNQYLIDFCSNHDEEEQLLLKHGSVEFFTTMRYIEKYITPDNHILEIGAGTGRYSHALARQSHVIDAVELVEHNMEIFRKNTRPGENITITQSSTINLSVSSDNKYDITLTSGSLYHLYNIADRWQVSREVIHVTKPGGIVFAVYIISDGCLLDEGFMYGNISVAEYIKNGLPDSETSAVKPEPKDLFELAYKEDIDHIMSVFSVDRLHYVVADSAALPMRDAMGKMNQDIFELYLKHHFAICGRMDLIDITSHATDIFRKLI